MFIIAVGIEWNNKLSRLLRPKDGPSYELNKQHNIKHINIARINNTR
jgi:hypothetical protein